MPTLTTKTHIKENASGSLLVSSAVFDVFRQGGLLREVGETGDGVRSWSFWGYETDDGPSVLVRCWLINDQVCKPG